MPLFEYGLVIWMSGKFSSTVEQLVNTTFLKYLKRYLNVPLSTHNSLVYFITNTLPLMTHLNNLSHKRISSIYLPACTEGIQLSFFNCLPSPKEIHTETSDIRESVPTYFWRSRHIRKLPLNTKYRREICREVCDSDHYSHCKNLTFHTSSTSNCKCKYCGENLHAYHVSYKFCNSLL